MIDQVTQLKNELAFYKSKFKEFTKITVALSKEKQLDKLLSEIVFFGRSFTNAEAGTLYKYNGDSLSFNVIQNDKLNIDLNSVSDEISWDDIPINNHTENLVSIYSAQHKQIINIDDIYNNSTYDFKGTKEFDKKNNYITKSVLVIPIINPENKKLLGILQLINKKDTEGENIAFTNEDIELLESLSAQSAVILERLEGELQQLRELNKKLDHLANTDQLTQISNRLKFNTILSNEFTKAQATNSPLSFIIFDIDKFKNVNDTYGHQIGDHVLVEIAKVVKTALGDNALFARWGGEEFVILLANTSIDKAVQIAEKIRIAIESHYFKEVEKITSSFGVSQRTENDTKESLVARADEALYHSKENGRNQVTIS